MVSQVVKERKQTTNQVNNFSTIISTVLDASSVAYLLAEDAYSLSWMQAVHHMLVRTHGALMCRNTLVMIPLMLISSVILANGSNGNPLPIIIM